MALLCEDVLQYGNDREIILPKASNEGRSHSQHPVDKEVLNQAADRVVAHFKAAQEGLAESLRIHQVYKLDEQHESEDVTFGSGDDDSKEWRFVEQSPSATVTRSPSVHPSNEEKLQSVEQESFRPEHVLVYKVPTLNSIQSLTVDSKPRTRSTFSSLYRITRTTAK
jgi:hypothetical protein